MPLARQSLLADESIPGDAEELQYTGYKMIGN